MDAWEVTSRKLEESSKDGMDEEDVKDAEEIEYRACPKHTEIQTTEFVTSVEVQWMIAEKAQ